MKFDYCIVGAGILGLAVAHEIKAQKKEARILVLEKEKKAALHQTGHNSGVLHTGIYYKPGSLKAVNCRQGKNKMQEFCEKSGIPFEICGKMIVAKNREELPVLDMLLERGRQNGVACERVSKEQMNEVEPHLAGIAGIRVPECGIVDYSEVCSKLSRLVLQNPDNRILFEHRVNSLEKTGGVHLIQTEQAEFRADFLINCSGLRCDETALLSGLEAGLRIIPFRGEYYELVGEAKKLCKHLIYPVPDLKFPFLGVHFTRMIGGKVECGPNAVLAFGKESYRKTDFNWRETLDILKFPGFRKICAKYWRQGLSEMIRSLSKKEFLKSARELIPELKMEDIIPAEAGIRAQAVSTEGSLLDDFSIVEDFRAIHLLNAPSPAATSALQIASTVVERLNKLP